MTAFLTKLRAFFAPKDLKRVVRFDDEGFTVFGDREPAHATWARVREVFAYKDDRFTYDDICIGFRFDDAGAYWWVAEDYVGYEALVEELKRRFPGIRDDWFSQVAFPAFVQNRTTIWGEPWPSPEKSPANQTSTANDLHAD